MNPGIHTIKQIGELANFSAFDDIIDVRSPAEFAEDHIPRSINCPVLDNAQRCEVGTLYKQVSPFAAKKIGAAYVSEIVCWRGGQRSGAMTHIFRRIGWDAQQMEGGYKRYRALVVERLAELPRQMQFKVICGATGSAKSRILHALARFGAQVLDLEELACHKGSVLGVLPDVPQPSQKMFDSRLLLDLQGFDPARPVFVEAESRKIGTNHLPEALIETMRSGQCLTVEATFPARVDFLLRDYDYFLSAPDWLNSRLDVLRNLQSKETIARWQGYATQGHWRALVKE
ncbi:tRNA 2-selenouridine(34) synthase MnmH, partial [bacterium]|nr:tRNA 2-selenouridine(34) synthase MnmH [bacterium]